MRGRALLTALLVLGSTQIGDPGTVVAQPVNEVTPLNDADLTAREVLRDVQRFYLPLQITREKVLQNQAKLLEKQGVFDTVIKGKAEVQPLGYYQHVILDAEVRQPTAFWGTDFFAGYRLGNGLGKNGFADYDGKKETLNLGEWRVGLNTSLLQNRDIDDRRATLSLLSLDIERAEMDLLAKQLLYLQDGLEAYWKWRALAQKELVATELLERAQIKVDQLQAEVDVGKTAPIYVTENLRSIYKRQQKLLEIQQDRQAALLKLRLYLDPTRSIPETPDPVPLIDSCVPLAGVDAAQRQALQQRPEVLAVALQQQQNDIGLQLAQNLRWPVLDLYFQLSQDIGEGDKSDKETEALGGVKFYYPPALRKAQGQLDRLDSIERALAAQLAFARQRIIQDIQTQRVKRDFSCLKAQLAEKEVIVAEQVAAAERERFELGSSTLFTVNLREEEAAEARLRYVDALMVYWMADSTYPLILGLLPRN